MRSRKSANDHVSEVARRRLELLSAELAQVRANAPAMGQDQRGAADENIANPTAIPAIPAVPPARTAIQHSASETAPTSQSPPGSAADVATTPLEAPTAATTSLDTPATPSEAAATPFEAAATLSDAPSARAPGRHALRSVGLTARAGGWLHDRLPPTLQGRVQIGASHLTVVALLVAAALAVTAWWVVRADGGGTIVPTAVEPMTTRDAAAAVVPAGAPAATETGTGAAPATTSTDTGEQVVVVDVAGKVRRPGIASLPLGSRVVDAIEAAGGPRRGVDLTTINLARLLVDGEQIVVGVPPPAGVAAPAASAPGASTAGAPAPLVNLNSATQAELETLPGVGPVTAAAILQWRTDNGAFSSVDELLEVSGIGDATLAEIAPFVTI
jgi:competence protein ComEA